MDKLRTITQAQDFLDREYSWRLQEIADLKSTVRAAGAVRQRTLVRAGIALLYGHWEGFIKRASEAYLNFVANQGHTYADLKPCFFARGVKHELSLLVEAGIGKQTRVAAESLLTKAADRARIPYEGAVAAKANLSSAVFSDIVESVGLSAAWYETRYTLIDVSLLSRRNRIAHGEFIDVDADDFASLANEVITLLRAYKTDIENALVLGTYRT